jgi:hypothetical protein
LHYDRLTLAFAALREPCPQTFGKALRRQAEAGFDLAIRQWKCVVEIRGIREIAHAELIEPIQRAGAALAANDYIHFEFLCVHSAIITSPRRRFWRD